MLRWALFSLCVFLAWHTPTATAQSLPVLELSAENGKSEVAAYVWRSNAYDDPITRTDVLNRLDEFQPIDGKTVRTFNEIDPTLFLLRVVNPSSRPGEWVFTTRRHSVNRLQIYDLSHQETVLLVDSALAEDNAATIRRFIGYGATIALEPGEEAMLAVHADIEVLRAMDFEIHGVDRYLDSYYWQTLRFSFIIPSLIIIILINAALFAIIGRAYFLFLALSELSFAVFLLHSANYIDVLGMAQYPLASIAMSEVAKISFVAFMSLFARQLISAKLERPALNFVLTAIFALGALLIVFWLVSPWLSKPVRIEARTISWMYVCLSTLIFPVVGYSAVRLRGKPFIPMTIGWSIVALAGLYIAAYMLFPPLFGLPRIVTFLSIVGLTEAVLVTFTVVWQIWREKEEHQWALEAHSRSLEAELVARRQVEKVADEKALAVATVEDQNAILQASGHDTRQVLLAIENATDYLQRTGSKGDRPLIDMLLASSKFLDDILSTTFSARASYVAERQCVALSIFPIDDFLKTLSMMYQPICRRKGIDFETSSSGDLYLVSDRALLMRAVSNLVANSVRATRVGTIACRFERRDGAVAIVISDTGSGIPADLQAELTSADETAPHSYAGSGFRIARMIVDQLKGRLTMYSEVGTGTEIGILLSSTHPKTTLISDDGLASQLGCEVVDLDTLNGAADVSDSADFIAITGDQGSQTRRKASAQYNLLLYRPLHAEYLEHPLLQALKLRRAGAPHP